MPRWAAPGSRLTAYENKAGAFPGGCRHCCCCRFATQYAPQRIDHPYGFFFGFWHGYICVFALIGKLLSWLASLAGISILDDVTVIGRPNTGFFYYFGFVLGFSAFDGSGGSAAR